MGDLLELVDEDGQGQTLPFYSSNNESKNKYQFSLAKI